MTENKKLISLLKYCSAPTADCLGCERYKLDCGSAHCVEELMSLAADTLESQQKRIEELERERRWVRPEERLPDVHKPVLVCREKEPGVLIVEQGCKDLGDWWRVYGTRVKRIRFWMPLPEAPKEG